MNIIMQNNSCFSIAMLREDIYFLNLAGISSQTLEIFKGLQFEGTGRFLSVRRLGLCWGGGVGRAGRGP